MSRYLVDSSDDEYPPGITVINRPRSRHGSSAAGERRRYPINENIHVDVAGDFLALPDHHSSRHRASSQGAAPQPQFQFVNLSPTSPVRGHSHHRHRPHSRGGSSHSSYEEDERIRYREHRRSDHGGGASPSLDRDTILKLERLRMLEDEEADRRHEENLKKEIELAKAREVYEAKIKKEKEEKLQKEYVEKWKMEEAAKKEKAKREKEEEDKKFEERFKKQFIEAGYSMSYAEEVLKKKQKEKEKHEEKGKQNALAIDLSRPTWIKVKRKYLLPQTLDAYYLPWEWDEKDSEYIIIKKWISQDLQDELFEHTRRIKEKKLIAGPVEKEVLTTLKVRDREKNQMYMVRRKSKSPGKGLFG